MDLTDSNRLWYGGAFAWRTNNRGTNWTRVSQFFASRIASWAIAPSDPNRVYAGVQHLGTTTSGRIFTTNVATDGDADNGTGQLRSHGRGTCRRSPSTRPTR